MSTWHKVCSLDEIPALGARVIALPAGDVAVFRTADDSVFALEDRCPHKGGLLSQGIVFGHKVACPQHGLVIELATAAAGTEANCVRSFPVIVTEGGSVWVWLDEPPEGKRRVAGQPGEHSLVQS